MKNSVVSPYFDEPSYKGQDVVHRGVRIPLSMDPGEALSKFSRRAQRLIEQNTDGFDFVEMTDAHLPLLRAMWFDPSDITFPGAMGEHVGITAVKQADGEVYGGIILAPAGAGLFIHQLVASKAAKGRHIPTRLVWEAVKRYHGKYHSVDVGVSYNPKRYEFFSNFAVETYPIILKKPFYTPVIRFAPFRILNDTKQNGDITLGNDVTFLPRASYAIQAVLELLKEDSERREVVIVKTFGSDFITGCVTKAIEKAGYSWILRGEITSNTRAVLAIHEFGLPVFQARDMTLLRQAQEAGVPIIEDCAWRAFRVWDWSNYVVISLQKIYPINYGGLLIGAVIPDEKLWDWGLLDVFKRDRLSHESAFDDGAAIRKRNWEFYHLLATADGMIPDDCYDYAGAVASGEWRPTVYMQRFKDDAEADAIVARLEEFGIQAGHYHGEPVVYLPIHQNMTLAEVEYMFAVVRGYFNLCRDYR
jgi:hypothetical protein